MEPAPKTAKPAYKPTPATLAITVAVLIAALGSGFLGGMQYQKGKGNTANIAQNGTDFADSAMGQRGGFVPNGSFGAVTAISATSISVQNERTSETKTYAITSSTTITNAGAAATYSDISVGNTVMVATANTTSTDATSISINPTMGRGMSAPGAASDMSANGSTLTN